MVYTRIHDSPEQIVGGDTLRQLELDAASRAPGYTRIRNGLHQQLARLVAMELDVESTAPHLEKFRRNLGHPVGDVVAITVESKPWALRATAAAGRMLAGSRVSAALLAV